MAYSVKEMSSDESLQEAVASFLAAFVRDGELEEPKAGDEHESAWLERFDWWWKQNPHCESNSPLGFVLYSEEEIVGFSGYIPAMYEQEGKDLPALIATTLFVREAHRSAVINLLSRQRSLGREYHVIDGSPSPAMVQLLNRFKFHHAEDRYQYYFPMKKFGGMLAQKALVMGGFSFPIPGKAVLPAGHYLTNSPDEVKSIPEVADSNIRRKVSIEGMQWLSQVGSQERTFVAYCDEAGELIAYAIGIYIRKRGLCLCLLEEYRDFRPRESGLGQLVRMLVDNPTAYQIAPDTSGFAISYFGSDRRPVQKGRKRDSNLYFSLPAGMNPENKVCLPIEGDLVLI